MSVDVLSDSAWRQYEAELVGEFLGPDFNQAEPPVVATLLERDHIPPQPFEAVRKVDRYAPAAAASATIGSSIVEGYGASAQFIGIERRTPGVNHTVFDRIGMDARRTWIDAADQLQSDPTSRLSDYLTIFDQRTLGIQPLPPGRVITAHHIASGGQLTTEIGGFLNVLSRAVSHENDIDKRQALCHSLVPVEIGRATVHLATIDSATPSWMSTTKIQLLHRDHAASSLTKANGDRLWQDGGKPSGEKAPRLKCPAHTHGSLKSIVHASINEAFERQVL